MTIHILGYGPITEGLYKNLSSKFKVLIYSDFSIENEIPVLSYSEFNRKSLGDRDVIVLGWRGMPSAESPKTQTLTILSKKLSKNQKLINLSSVAVYGNTTTPAQELQEPSPINEYGLSKSSFEQYCDLNLDSIIVHLRISNVFGHISFDDIVNRILRSGRTGEHLTVFKPSQIQRDFISIDTLVGIISQIISNSFMISNSEVINVCSGKSITLLELIRMVQEFNNCELNVIEAPIPSGIIVNSLVSNEKIKKLFPMEYSFELINLRKYVMDF